MNVVEVFFFFIYFFLSFSLRPRMPEASSFLSLMQLWRKIGKEKKCAGMEGGREG